MVYMLRTTMAPAIMLYVVFLVESSWQIHTSHENEDKIEPIVIDVIHGIHGTKGAGTSKLYIQ